VAVYEVEGGVSEVLPSTLVLADGRRLPFDDCLWSTQASAASWLADTGLPVDKGGWCGVISQQGHAVV
jgi:selenide,water dikinase